MNVIGESAGVYTDNHEEESSNYADNGDGTHTRDYICPRCGATISETNPHNDSDRDGICDQCGASME